MSTVVVAVYHTASQAQNIRQALEKAEVPREDIGITERVDPAVTRPPASFDAERGALYWLSGILEPDEEAYRHAVTLSRMAVAVQVREEDVHRIEAILQQFGPALIDERKLPIPH